TFGGPDTQLEDPSAE
ncbi:hypothetical protein A2U01_0083383, partial [Trifolium medium]|nr:hypothetical protein [Trifolium medium]